MLFQRQNITIFDVVGLGLWTMNYGSELLIMDYEIWTMDYELWI